MVVSLCFYPSGLLTPFIGVWCEGSLFWNAVSPAIPATSPNTGWDGCGRWHDRPALVSLVFRLWLARKKAPTGGVNTSGTATVALTEPIRAISILPFTIITTVRSTCIRGVEACPEGCPLRLHPTPSSSLDLCCSFVDPLGNGKAQFLVGSGLGCVKV